MNIVNSFCKAGLTTAAVTLIGWGLAAVTHNWVAPQTASAQIVIPPPPPAWTAVGASGSVDESSIPIFGFTNASAGYGPNASVAPLEFRYNVVNTHHPVSTTGAVPTIGMPGWTQMEFGAQAPATSIASAYLYRVDKCTGQQYLVCAVTHTQQPAPGTCRRCQFTNTTFNFAQSLYYIRVVLDRNSPGEAPAAHTLRVY